MELVRSDLLGNFGLTGVFQAGGNAGRPESVISNLRLNACVFRDTCLSSGVHLADS